MNFRILRAQGDEDWDFFFKLGFEMLKVLRKFMYDSLVEKNPDASDEELANLHRKETEEYFDFSKPDARVFIAKTDDGVPCGYLWIGGKNSKDVWDTENPQWIYDIVVAPTFRGHGLGRKLMQKGEDFARELNLNLGLFVHSDNTPAITLYEKMEYRIKQVPISKRLESINTTASPDGSFIIREEQDTDLISIQIAELERFTKKVRFSAKADDNIVKQLYEEHLEKFSKKQEKHQRLVALTKESVIAGSIWVGNSGFDEGVAMIHELVIDSTHDSHLVGNQLIDSAEKWAKNAEFSVIYMLLHAEEDVDLEFFKERNYKVPGFFMQKRLKT
ncbi:MAG: GNAT family N-acetyltransferase [Candidatus Thorarchaeota archaeon]